MAERPDAFIARHLKIHEIEGLSGLRLYGAHPGSGLSRLGDTPPYWAFCWAGGMALARHVTANPEIVRGRRVVEYGAGSGLVGIAAALAGAAEVTAMERDPYGVAAVQLNAALNGVAVRVVADCPASELVLAGDVFYGPEVAAQSLDMLDALSLEGADILVGDPGRRDLPLDRLTRLAGYDVKDADGKAAQSGVYAFRRPFA